MQRAFCVLLRLCLRLVEVGLDAHLAFVGGLTRLLTLQHPSHVVRNETQCLHAFLVLDHFFGFIAVDNVPILRGNNGHRGDLEILVDGVKCSAGTASAAGYDGSCGLVEEEPLCIVENAVEYAFEAACHAGKVYGRADDHAVGILDLFNERIDAVVVKHTLPLAPAGTAVDTAADGTLADPKDFGVNAPLFELLCNFGQSGKGAAVLVRAAVDE